MVNVGVVGIGYWGPNLIRNFNALRDFNVDSIYDINKDRTNYIKA